MARQTQARKRLSLPTQELQAGQNREVAKSPAPTRRAQQTHSKSVADLGAKPKAKAATQRSLSGQRDAVLAGDGVGRIVAAQQSTNRSEGGRRVNYTEEDDRAMRQWVAERPIFPDRSRKI